MTAKEIFNKTMPFCMAKLALGGATVLLSTILFAIVMGIGWLFGDGGLGVALIIWIIATGIIRFAIMHYMGYLVKAGHVAVIAESMKTGKVPDNQVAYGKTKVTERFASSNIYFAVDKLVTSAVKQIQNGIEKVGNALDFIPGMDAIAGLAKFFVNISLGYVDECCLGWTFYNPEQGAFQSAADAVVIYAQNWKTVLKDAAKTMLKVVLGMIGIALIIFIPLGLLFKLFKWSPFIAFLLACMLTWIVKFAFVDSYIMCQMMVGYMQVAPTTVLSFDLYGNLCNISSSFKELFNKGREESPAPAYAATAQTTAIPTAGQTAIPTAGQTAIPASVGTPASQVRTAPVTPPQPAASKPIFCGQCGTKNEAGAKFCGSCGAPM